LSWVAQGILIGRERGITLAETVFLGDALNDEHLTNYVEM
jgi:hypothetical protein